MMVAIFILLILFVAANAWVEARNDGPGKTWMTEPLSWYLHGKRYSWLQSLAYLGWVAAEVMMIAVYAASVATTVALIVAAAGLTGVVATANMHGQLDFPGRRRAHVACAGAAYAGMIGFQLLMLWHTPAVWLPIGALTVAAAFLRWAPQAHSIDEKLVTLVCISGMLPIVGLPL